VSSRFGFLQLPLRYLITIGIAVLVALAALAFVRVTIADLELRSQKQSLERDVAAMRTENETLHAKVDYLQTDGAVEKLAREELGWTKPGDTAIVVVRPPVDSTPIPTAVPAR
jgi:cell division protein FtsB